MASPDTQNVVVISQSMGETSPVDVHATQPSSESAPSGSANGHVADPSKASGDHSTDSGDGATAQGDGPSQSQADGSQSTSITGIAQGADLKSFGDGASVQGSAPDTESVRDTVSIGDSAPDGEVDGSRLEGSEQLKDVNGNIKSSAAKKPTSFKAVSVTKNFLAKAASSTTPVAKAGDKATLSLSTPQTVARPRLVAKSGSGLRDSPRARPGVDGSNEATTVWNKNRPAPPLPPKQFTDEELKQQYGIHLASRIQNDDSNSNAKWADLDDDDENSWAPETLEWMDGTKSKINADPIPPPQEPPKVVTAIEQRSQEVKPVLTPLKRHTSTGTPKTILRPGAAQLAKQDMANGKDSSEPKSAAGSKLSASTPVKSPWAALPPVEKSASLFQPPPPQPPSRPTFESQDARNSMIAAAPSHAHEMEADTFDRSWREPERAQRELFNSQSGRYEPVSHARRESFRTEQGPRQPAVLYRAVNDEAVDNSSYHTRSSQDGSPWGNRRRGSSFGPVNGLGVDRRASATKPGEHPAPTENRTGIVIGHDISSQPKHDPKQAQNEQKQMTDQKEEVARQRRLMHEKAEMAVQRRREEEAKEEAARKERIRLKLEAMGPMPATDKPKVVSETAAAPSHNTSPATRVDNRDNTAQPNTQPPRTGEQSTAREVLSDTKAAAQPPSQAPPTIPHTSPSRTFRETSAVTSSFSSPGEQKAQPAFRSPALQADSFATWGNRNTNNQSSQNSNVWGPPGALRYIGNGAFDAPFSRVPPRLQNQNPNLQQASHFTDQRSPSAGGRQQETSPMRHQQMLSDQNLASLGLTDTPVEKFSPSLPAGSNAAMLSAHPRSMPLQPIGPPRQVSQPNQHQEPARGVAAWVQMAADARANPQARQPATASQPESLQQTWTETWTPIKPRGLGQTSRAAPVVTLRSTGNPAPPIAQSQSSVGPPTGTTSAQESTVRLPVEPTNFSRAPAAKTPNATRQTSSSVAPHHSRFFPSWSNGGSPPPEESSHPVHDNVNKAHPVVRFPKAKPNVRLPPSAAELNGGAVTMPQRTPSYRAGAQPLVHSNDWQARFNGLFNRINTTTATPPSPPKTPEKANVLPSPAPTSETKDDIFAAMEKIGGTCVQLPVAPGGVQRYAMTFPPLHLMPQSSAELEFDGELSFGSTPKVSVPRQPTYSFGPGRAPKSGPHLLTMSPSAKFDRRVEPASKEWLSWPKPAPRDIAVRVPGSSSTHYKRSYRNDNSRNHKTTYIKPFKGANNIKENNPSQPSTPASKGSNGISRATAGQDSSNASPALNGPGKSPRGMKPLKKRGSSDKPRASSQVVQKAAL